MMHICIEGSYSEDHVLSAATAVQPKKHGILLTHPITNKSEWIVTDQEPLPGAKVFALSSLNAILDNGFVGRRENGGGAVRVAIGTANWLRDHDVAGNVQLLNAGPPAPGLAALCAEHNIRLHALGRQGTPRNLIVPLGKDRLIVPEKVTASSTGLDDGQLAALAGALEHADAVASVSSKDRALAVATLALGNGAKRYFQPGGLLGREETLGWLAVSHGVVGNFDDVCRLGWVVNLPLPGFTEELPEAADHAVKVLVELHHRGLAGKEAAVCTMGRRGSVVADWRRGRLYRVVFETTGDVDGPPSVPGCGDFWLARWILYREVWAAAHWRDPEAAAAVRASQAVARHLGLGHDQYRVWEMPISSL